MYSMRVCEASEQCYWSSLKWWRKDIVSYSNSTFGLGSSVSVGWVKITITLRQKSEGLSWLSVWWNVAVIIEKIWFVTGSLASQTLRRRPEVMLHLYQLWSHPYINYRCQSFAQTFGTQHWSQALFWCRKKTFDLVFNLAHEEANLYI